MPLFYAGEKFKTSKISDEHFKTEGKANVKVNEI